MPNFIDDDLVLPSALPEAKTDSRPLLLPANKTFRAADYNALKVASDYMRSALVDTRSAVRSTRADVTSVQDELSAVSDAVAAVQADLAEGLSVAGGLPVVNIATAGALADGSDQRANIQAAINSISGAGGGVVYVPAGVFTVGRSSTNSWCLDLPDNVVIQGVKGKSVLRAASGMPNSAVAVIRINERSNVSLRDMIIDGNWGNLATRLADSMHGLSLPQATISVESTTVGDVAFPASGTFQVQVAGGGLQTITYTGITGTSFTGCTGGTGTLVAGDPVGRSDSQAGLNHSTQADPKNYGVWIRGSYNVAIVDCIVRNTYGDAIWIGQGGTDYTKYSQKVSVVRTLINMSARSGIAAAQKCHRITVDDCEFVNTYAQCWDTEPVGIGFGVHDVRIVNSKLGRWWACENPARDTNIAIAIVGGYAIATSQADAARGFRIVNCVIEGPVLVQNAHDIILRDNRILCDWTGKSYAAVLCQYALDDIVVEGNFIYSRTQTGAVVAVSYYANGSVSYQPRGVRIANNRIHARNSLVGVAVLGSGGTDFGGVVQPGISGTATAVTATTVVDSGKAWTANQWKGYTVRIGTAHGPISINDGTTLTISGWFSALGERILQPPVGAYTIVSNGGGVVSIEENRIDCTDDGRGAGGVGILLSADRAGMRCRARGNIVRNATGSAISVSAPSRTMVSVELADNLALSDLAVSPTTQHILFTNPSNIGKIILRNNQQDGVATPVSGLTAGYWLISDGETQEFAGWGSPDGVVTARVGSTYRRRNDGAARALWLKQSGENTNTGWVGLTQPLGLDWDVDPGAGFAVPANVDQWTALIAAAGLAGVVLPPVAIWLMQEASGDLADVTGAFPLSPAGTGYGYQAAFGTTWTRKAVAVTDNVQGSFSSVAAGLPDVGQAAGVTLFGYANETISGSPNVNRQLMGMGTTQAWLGGAGALRVNSAAQAAYGGAPDHWGVPRPYVLTHKPNPSGATIGFTNDHAVQPTLSTPTGKRFVFGGVAGQFAPPSAQYAYGALFPQALTQAQVRAILTTAGWPTTI